MVAVVHGAVPGDPGPGGRPRPPAAGAPADPAFATLTALAAHVCSTSSARVTLLGRAGEWVTGGDGPVPPPEAWERHLGARVAATRDVLVVPDTRAPDTGPGPLWPVGPTGPARPGFRFCAGAPLVTADGLVAGVLWVLDAAPRALDDGQRRLLVALAREAASRLELHRRVHESSTGPAAVATRERARLMEGVLTHTDALVYAKDLDGRFVLTNDALEAAVATPDGLLGHTDHELFPRATADDYREHDTRVTSTGTREVVTEELVHLDGSHHTYRSTKFPLVDGAGRVFGLGGVSTDVTELVESRTAHVAAEARWQALVEHSPVAVAVLDSRGRFAYANPCAVRLYGAAGPADLLGRPARDLVPPGEEASTTALFGRLLAGGVPVLAHRWTLRQLGGALLTVEVNAAGVSHDGAPAVQVELRDVTEAAAAQRALAESERRSRALFDHSPVSMALSDAEGRWVHVNAAFTELTGLAPERAVGMRPREIVHPADVGVLDGLAVPDPGVGDHGHRRVELRFVRPDGDVRWVWVSTSPTPGPDGRTLTLAITQDVTARKQAELALQQSEADLAALARVARCVQQGSDPRPVVVDAVRELSQAATVSLFERRDETSVVVTACCDGFDSLGIPVPLDGTSMTAEVWRTGTPVFLADAAADPRVNPALLALDRTRSMLWQPVVVDGSVQALLVVTWRHRVASLGARAADAVRVVADETGASLQAAQLRHELERSASTDPLTGSLNRRAWDTHLLDVLAAAQDTGAPLTIALVDLDHFKVYNDTRGHGAGDVLLRDFAAAARTVLRKDDVFARWGGEEFVLALPDTTPDQAVQVLERVRTSVPDGRTCSVGHTTWRSGESVTACIARADAALYDAKHTGRDRLARR